MQFRTELTIKPSASHIGHDDELLLMGSCFSENLGGKLKDSKFKVNINPFGIIYDPISIFRILDFAVENKSDEFHAVERDNAWYVYEAHSEIFAEDKASLDSMLDNTVQFMNYQLSKNKYLFITLGTSFVYKLLENNLFVANCHKMPSSNFQKIMLDPEQIIEAFKVVYNKIRLFNPELQIVFTVSPVRHIKDGIENNQISKSILRYCISKFCEMEAVHYFPAYELVLDDLRDYRFYKEDLIHPNEMASNYVWGKFSDFYFKPSTKELLALWGKAKQNMDHRPFNVKSDSYKKHLELTMEQLTNLSKHLDVKNELQFIKILFQQNS